MFNNISLDGGDYNNGFFGEQMGGQRAAIDITLEAVKEFQVVATGATAEYGRTAGGVVNVITKSGTNQVKGSMFYFQRLEGLTSKASDGKPLTDFHRQQYGGTVGGPVQKDRAFFFCRARRDPGEPAAAEPVGADRHAVPGDQSDAGGQRSADQRQRRLPAAGAASTSSRPDCNQDEGQPVDHTVNNTALLAKADWNVTPANNLSVSYNFDHSNNRNQTFDVADLRHDRQRHRRAVEDQHAEPEPVQLDHVEQAERVARHLLA